MKNPDVLVRLLGLYPTLDLSHTETVCLMHLLVLAERGQVSTSVTDLARRMALHPSSVKRLLARLKQQGVIERTDMGTLLFTDALTEKLLWGQ